MVDLVVCEVEVTEVVDVEAEVEVVLDVLALDELEQVVPEQLAVVAVVFVVVVVPVLMLVAPPPPPKTRTIARTDAVQRMPIVNATATVICLGITIHLRH